jgi:hypothetical protein
MKMIRPSINVKYCIEVKRDFHDPDSDWQALRFHKKLQDAIDDIEFERHFAHKQEFRLTRLEWTVIG